MKKLIAWILSALMLLSLCACGGQTPETPDASTPAASEPSETADLKALAESCIDKPVEELFALIGQPESSDYAPSCLNPGVGEDGNLYYDGFTVYTYREGDQETVSYVE